MVRETEGMEGFKGHVQIVENDGVAGRIDRRLPLLFLLAFFYVRQRICITMGSTDCVTAFRSTLPRPRLEQALYSDILMQCRLERATTMAAGVRTSLVPMRTGSSQKAFLRRQIPMGQSASFRAGA